MENKYVGIIGIITLLLGFGGSILLTPTEQVNTYYCESSNTVGVFYGGISGTGLTAYPYIQNRTKSVKCETGWVKLSETKTFPNPEASISGVIKYSCNTINCTRI